MAGRRLSAEEDALWRRVAATVRPIKPHPASQPIASDPARLASSAPLQPRPTPHHDSPAKPIRPVVRTPGITLDGSWDRRLASGAIVPDASIDLHGYNLEAAHQRLDAALDRAIRQGDRVLLLITGRPPRPESERPHARGRIRAAIGDWLAASRHADRIAAIRGAHPRHGGAGALYIILRRDRARSKN